MKFGSSSRQSREQDIATSENKTLCKVSDVKNQQQQTQHSVIWQPPYFHARKAYQVDTPAQKLELDPDNSILKDIEWPLLSHLFQLDSVPPQQSLSHPFC